MDNETYEGQKDQMILQVKIQAKRLWRTAGIWKKIHQDLLISGNVVFDPTVANTFSRQLMALPPGGLHDCLYSGANQAWNLY